MRRKSKSERDETSNSINKLCITPDIKKLFNQTKLKVQINPKSAKNPTMKLNCWRTRKSYTKKSIFKDKKRYASIRGAGESILKELKTEQKKRFLAAQKNISIFSKKPQFSLKSPFKKNRKKFQSKSFLSQNTLLNSQKRERNNKTSSLASIKEMGLQRKKTFQSPTRLRRPMRPPPQDIEKLKRESVLDIMNKIWDRPYVKKKLKKFLNFLNGLKIQNSDLSYQEFLYNISQKSLPKHNWLNDLNLKQNWVKSKYLFEDMCRCVEKRFTRFEAEELRRIGFYKSHLNSLKIRDRVKKKVEAILKEKLDHDKAFKNQKGELLNLLRLMKEKFPKEKIQKDNSKKIANLRMMKYAKDWDSMAHLGALHTIRRNHRKALYMEKLRESKEKKN